MRWSDTAKLIEQTGQVKDPRHGRKFLMARDGHCCQICKRKTWNKTAIPLVLDHIDGSAENGSLTNLRLICCNCDAQLPTYKKRNYGKGRHLRRLRYQAGLSY